MRVVDLTLILSVMGTILLFITLVWGFNEYDSMITGNQELCRGQWISDTDAYYCDYSNENRNFTQTWNKNIVWELFR